MLFTITTCTLSILALIGVVLNIYKKRLCFFIWAITNTGWTIIDFQKEIYAQSALFFVYFLLALWGIYKWRT
uniref:Putative nicotinamide mononucleotide transporter n=1 Tax=viral metagenome TaxID=1070528 RepID=A0A6M3KL56_9ZZZZ